MSSAGVRPGLIDRLPSPTENGLFQQTYGYFEIRADLPKGQAVWPAFWMLPADLGPGTSRSGPSSTCARTAS
jgi:hypothetical protein